MEGLHTSSRHIVEADLTVTKPQAVRIQRVTRLEQVARMALSETTAICAVASESCRLARQIDIDERSGKETLTFRCVSDDEKDSACGLVNGPYLACDRAADMMYMALGGDAEGVGEA
jgi:hypothetical protein